jgi:DUF1365 family protein
LFLLYLDLEETSHVFERFWLWSTRRFNLAWWRRSDHVGDPAKPLSETIRDKVLQETGSRPKGPIRLLCHPRYWGFTFNPVSFYYCFEEDRNTLHSIVCEVNNTPWGEGHLYVLPATDSLGQGRILKFKREKAFHVSPFMPMDIDYDWRFNLPEKALNVHMQNYREGNKVFDATMVLERKEISSANLSSALLRFPFVTAKVVFAIYYQALRLRLKRVPFYDHPQSSVQPNQVSKL